MAIKETTLYASTSIFTESKNPTTNNKRLTEILVKGPQDGTGANGYEFFAVPDGVFGKKFIDGELFIHGKEVPGYYSQDIYAIDHSVDPSSVTWYNSPPTASDGTGLLFIFDSSYAWKSFLVTMDGYVPFKKTFAHLIAYGIILRGYFYYHTANSNYKPYIKFHYDDSDCGLQPDTVFPKNGIFQNNKNGVTVQWSNSILEFTIGNVTQKKAVITWMYGSTTKTATINGTATTYTIPASNLPETGTVTWKVAVTDSAGNTNTSTTATFTTTDTTCYAYPSSPVNEYIDGSKPVTFAWTRSISTGSAANGADFQISTDNGISWQDLGHADGSDSFLAAANTLPAGNVLWRVRGYNSDGVAGPWSDPAAIVVRRAPDAPIITEVTTVPQPTVSWQVEGQQAYQLQVWEWDSGTVYGTEKSAQVPYAMPDGTFQARLRIQNSFGLWSDWATAEVTIVNQPGEPITAKTRVVLGGVRLTWDTEGDYPTYAILRDGKEIATVAGKEYTDYTGIGRSRYVVRGLNADSTYTDSPAVVEILRLRSGLIAQEGVWDWMLLDRRVGARPAHSGSQEEDTAYTWFSGRALPVAEISGHRQVTARYDYTLQSLTQLEKLRDMSGQKVVYKHRDGELFRGLLGNLSWNRNRGRWDVSFTITEVDDGPVF